MDIIKIYTPSEVITLVDSQLLPIFSQVLHDQFAAKSHHRILIVTDPQMQREASVWFEAGKTITPHTQVVVIDGMTQNAQEPPSLVGLMMAKSHIVILQTNYSMTHTKARQIACSKGARIASLPTATLDILNRTLKTDYVQIKTLSQSLSNRLSLSSNAHITTANGTDISLEISNRSGIADTGFFTNPGEYGNLPAGEAFIAPIEGTAQGIFVVDGSFADITLDQPIHITVQDGLATSITGGTAADQLSQILSHLPPEARTIAELGIGTNPAADPKGSLIEAEKAFGTVHIALGNNATIGGHTSVPFHSDGVILSPTLTLDGQPIITNGVFDKQVSQ